MSNYWVFMVTDHIGYRAETIFENRIKIGKWLLNSNARNFNNLRVGDLILFYIGGKSAKGYVGIGKLKFTPRLLETSKKTEFIGNLDPYFVEFEFLERFRIPLTTKEIGDDRLPQGSITASDETHFQRIKLQCSR